jgi:hypothetical protein
MQLSKAHRQTDMSHQSPPTATEEIRELLGHLTRTNPYFALWDLYKRGVSENSVAGEWREFLLEHLGPESEQEIEFACAMVDLDKLLAVYRDQRLALPMLLFERICFLHYIRGAERMAQTRAVLGTLTAELAACTSA